MTFTNMITFNRDVRGCACSATLDEPAMGEISVYRGLYSSTSGTFETTKRQVSVWTRNSAGMPADKPFQLVVQC